MKGGPKHNLSIRHAEVCIPDYLHDLIGTGFEFLQMPDGQDRSMVLGVPEYEFRSARVQALQSANDVNTMRFNWRCFLERTSSRS